MPSHNKVTIIGAGLVGSTTAYSLLAANAVDEVALVDINPKLAKSQVMDLQHSVPFWGYAKVKVGTYEDVRDSAVVVFTAGANQKPGETRIDLVKKNSGIVREAVPKIFRANPKAVLVMVTNPVDVLTHLAVRLMPAKARQILGTGTVLDTARFRFLIGQQLGLDPRSVHAYIVGEHGDSELPLWSSAAIGTAPVRKFRALTPAVRKRIFSQAKNAAYTIIAGKQATYYAIAAGTTQVVQTILFNKRTVVPVSHLLAGQFGIRNVCLSLPAILGRRGVVATLDLDIDPGEKRLLLASAKKLKAVNRSIRA